MIIWDTGPLFAAADVDDRDHSHCVELMRHTPAPLLMPVPVLTEVGYLLEREKGARAEAEFLRSIRAGQVMMVPLTAADLDRMAELVETYGDFPLGLVDASVMAPPQTAPDGLAVNGMQEVRGSNPLSSTFPQVKGML